MRMEIIDFYHHTKGLAAGLSGQSFAMLHVHAGLLIYIVCQIAIRDRRGSWLALGIVAQAELLNEILDNFYFGSWRWTDTISDVVLTLMWPTLLVLVSYIRRRRWAADQLRLAAVPLGSSRRKRLAAAHPTSDHTRPA